MKALRKAPLIEAAALAAIVLGLALCWTSLDAASSTYDEPNYLDAARRVAEDFRFDSLNTILHPPLTFLLNGLLIGWAPSGDFTEDLNKARKLTLLLFYLGTAVLVYVWSREMFGSAAGLLSLFLFALCPVVMAHARLATTDMAACCTFFAAFYGLWRLFRKPSPATILICGVLLGAAFLAKYSTVLIVPIAAVLYAVTLPARRQSAPHAGGKKPFWLMLAGAFGVGLLVLLAAYGFSGAFRTLGSQSFQSGFFTTLAGIPGLNAIPIPLPGPYLQGVDFQKQITETGFTSFLLGEKFYSGVWYYFPVCFLCKMPIPFMALTAAGAWVLARRRSDIPYGRLFVILPPLLFFAYLVYPNTSNAGFRYALPVIPFLAVIAGACLWKRTGSEKADRHPLHRLPKSAVVLLASAILVITLLIHPHYLAYHNLAAGGPGEAYRIMAGSDLDWGQDSGAAAAYWRSLGDREDAHLSPGILPVTGQILIGVNELNDCLRRRDVHGWLRMFEPYDSIGYTYLRYSLSLDDFRRLADDNPDDPLACYAHAGALLAEGRQKDCRAEIDRGLELAPGNGLLLFLEGAFYSRVREKAEAVRSLREAVAADPSLLDAHRALRFLLLRSGRADEAEEARRTMIEAEIRLAHIAGVPRDRKRLEEKAAAGAELCTLTVLTWLDGDEAESVGFARDAVAADPLNVQALGNLLFLVHEVPRAGTFSEARLLLRKLSTLATSARARSTPMMKYGDERIVFGNVLTFAPPTAAQVDALALLRGELPLEADACAATVRALLMERRLSDAQALLSRGTELFPDDRSLDELENFMQGQEQSF